MDQGTLRRDQIIAQLENLIAKTKLHSPQFSDLEIRILPSQVAGNPYVVDISSGRFSRRVTVDARTAQHFHTERLDQNLSRELRSAMISVARWAKGSQ